MIAITTPEMFVELAGWEAIPVYTDKQKTTMMHRKAQTPVWTTELFDALPETVRLGLLRHSSSSDVMARDIRRGAGDASDNDMRLRFAKRIFGLRAGGATRTVEIVTLAFPGCTVRIEHGDVVDAVAIYGDAMAAATDLGIPHDVADAMVRKVLADNGLKI